MTIDARSSRILGALLVVALAGALAAGCGSIVVTEDQADTTGGSDTSGGDTGGGDAAGDTAAPPECTFGDDAACDDGDPCTVNACNTQGQCTTAPATDVCKIDGVCYDDGEASSANACKVCDVSASKTAWSAVTCAPDGNPCTDDACDPDDGCAFAADDAAPCDDGVACTTDDRCEGGACVATPCGCTSDAFCEAEITPDPCHRAACVAGSCTLVADEAQNGDACDDGDVCTAGDACSFGVCAGEPVDCTTLDGPCAAGVCVDGACTLELAAPGTGCDGGACTVDATCTAAGNCLGAWDTATCGCKGDAECDDGRACTADTCDVASGACSHVPVPGSCLLLDQCFTEGDEHPFDACLVCDPAADPLGFTAKACDDGDACTADACDPVAGCTHAPAPAGECCKLAADCLADGFTAGPCQLVACVKGACEVVPDETAEGDPCEDGDACTVGDACSAGACVAGVAKSCEIPGPGACATVACVPQSGDCVETPLTAGEACDDADPCTLGDACGPGGACAGTEKACTGGDACNAAACDATSGECTLTAKAGAACDDGEACTLGDVCDETGVCAGTWDGAAAECSCQADADCDDGLACTGDTCDVASGACSNPVKPGGCVIDGACVTAGATKPDNACLACLPGKSLKSWQPVTCDDGNVCTQDYCDPATGCATIPKTGTPCSDGNPDTTDDACENGVCVATCLCASDADCAGAALGAACVKAVCDKCQCVVVPDPAQEGAACEDGLFCTVGDACASGVCAPGGPRDCKAEGDGVCLVGACDEVGNACVPTPKGDGSACSDEDPCTLGDACSGGACKGAPKDCSDLEDACHTAACDGGACVQTTLTGASCDDGEACTLGDTCQASGACAGAWDKETCGCTDDADCVGETDLCNTGRCDVATNACFKEPKVGAPCDDGQVCTSGDACSDAGVCKGNGYTCKALACEVASCDGKGGCDVQLLPGYCRIDGTCWADGEGNPGSACQVCNSSLAAEAWSARPKGTPCDADGSGCTVGDACDGGACVAGAPADCDDGLTCTDAQCVPIGAAGFQCKATANGDGCFIGGACLVASTPNPLNACQACDPATSATAWSNVPAATACDADGNGCTVGDACQAGVCKAGALETCDDGFGCTGDQCVSSGPETYTCKHAISSGSCLIDADCWASGAKDPGNPCRVCDPAKNTTGWSNAANGTTCDADGNGCTVGDSCQAGACVKGTVQTCADDDACTTDKCTSNGPTSFTCTNTVEAGSCLIGGQCVADGATNPSNPCEVCDSAKDETGWTAASNGTACNADSNGCTVGDACQDGVCKAGEAASCSDGLACTEDLCQSTGAATYKCANTVDAEACLIGGKCYGSGAPNPGNACQFCDPTKSQSGWASVGDGASCNADGNGCTAGDQCVGGVCKAGSTVSCNDNKSCTLDSCVSAGASAYTCSNVVDPNSCLIGGVCYGSGTANPSNACQQCTPLKSQTSWFNKPDGTSCNADGSGCTVGDSCQSGTCTKGAAPNCSDNLGCTGDVCTSTGATSYVCSNPINGSSCLVNGACYTSGANDPANDCRSCQPGTSQTAFTNKAQGSACELGESCTSNDKCNGSGTCTYGTIASQTCYISGSCYSQWEYNPKNNCFWCNANVSQTTWSDSLDCGLDCNQGIFCTKSIQCGPAGFCSNNTCVCF